MRNLKKILALVLALVMSLSLMATAGAADNSAAANSETISAEYQTAKDVLSALGVFKGYEDGSFKPKQSITRAEVATILYRMVTGDVASARSDIYGDMQQSTFTDLAGANWARGYINYCANAKLIVGVGGNKFQPSANITGYATLAMVLRALGYDKNGEFQGTGWEIRTASTARELGILNNVNAAEDLGKPATREMVAEILFRAMLCDMVEYNALTQDYKSVGVTLGYKVFTLEKVEGVVVANEYADIRRDADGKSGGYSTISALAGSTVLRSADKDRIVKTASTLEDLGETRIAYTTEKTNTVRDTYDDLRKIPLENPDKDTITYDGGEAKSSLSGLVVGNEAEHFINFGETTSNVTTTIKVTYQANKIETVATGLTSDAATRSFLNRFHLVSAANLVVAPTYAGSGVYDITYIPSADDEVMATTSFDAGHTYSVRNVDGTYFYTVEITPGSTFTTFDVEMVTAIFNYADRVANPAGVTLVVNGEVYRGTQSVYDFSDGWFNRGGSYEDFRAACLKESEENTSVTGNSNGWWLKIIDNDKDGVTDWVFQTRYTVATVSSIKDGVPTLETDGLWTNHNDSRNAMTNASATTDESGDLVAGDVVYYAVIDGVARAYKADVVEARVNTVNRNAKSITTVDGTTYDESEVHEHSGRTDIASRVVNMSGTTNYKMYLDKYGYLAAFSQNITGKFVLLTNGWARNVINGTEFAVTAWDSESKGYNVYNVTSGGSQFIRGANNNDVNSWNNIRWFPALNCNDITHTVPDDIHSIVAYMEVDGENATLRSVDTIYDIEDQNNRGYWMIDTGVNIPDSTITNGTVYQTTTSAGQPYDLPGTPNAARVRALSTTTYYYVYRNQATTVTVNEQLGVHQITGYEAGAKWLNATDRAFIEDVYVVGRQAQDVDTAGNTGVFYTADVVVVEMSDEFRPNHLALEQVFIYDFPTVSTSVMIEEVSAIRADGSKATLKIDLTTSRTYTEANATPGDVRPGRAFLPGLYYLHRTDRTTADDIWAVEPMSHWDILNSSVYDVGTVSASKDILPDNYVITYNWFCGDSVDLLVAGDSHGTNDNRLLMRASAVENERRTGVEASKYYTLSYDGTGRIGTANETTAGNCLRQPFGGTPDDSDINQVLVRYNDKDEIVYAVSFAHTATAPSGATIENAAQSVWRRVALPPDLATLKLILIDELKAVADAAIKGLDKDDPDYAALVDAINVALEDEIAAIEAMANAGKNPVSDWPVNAKNSYGPIDGIYPDGAYKDALDEYLTGKAAIEEAAKGEVGFDLEAAKEAARVEAADYRVDEITEDMQADVDAAMADFKAALDALDETATQDDVDAALADYEAAVNDIIGEPAFDLDAAKAAALEAAAAYRENEITEDNQADVDAAMADLEAALDALDETATQDDVDAALADYEAAVDEILDGPSGDVIVTFANAGLTNMFGKELLMPEVGSTKTVEDGVLVLEKGVDFDIISDPSTPNLVLYLQIVMGDDPTADDAVDCAEYLSEDGSKYEIPVTESTTITYNYYVKNEGGNDPGGEDVPPIIVVPGGETQTLALIPSEDPTTRITYYVIAAEGYTLTNNAPASLNCSELTLLDADKVPASVEAERAKAEAANPKWKFVVYSFDFEMGDGSVWPGPESFSQTKDVSLDETKDAAVKEIEAAAKAAKKPDMPAADLKAIDDLAENVSKNIKAATSKEDVATWKTYFDAQLKKITDKKDFGEPDISGNTVTIDYYLPKGEVLTVAKLTELLNANDEGITFTAAKGVTDANVGSNPVQFIGDDGGVYSVNATQKFKVTVDGEFKGYVDNGSGKTISGLEKTVYFNAADSNITKQVAASNADNTDTFNATGYGQITFTTVNADIDLIPGVKVEWVANANTTTLFNNNVTLEDGTPIDNTANYIRKGSKVSVKVTATGSDSNKEWWWSLTEGKKAIVPAFMLENNETQDLAYETIANEDIKFTLTGGIMVKVGDAEPILVKYTSTATKAEDVSYAKGVYVPYKVDASNAANGVAISTTANKNEVKASVADPKKLELTISDAAVNNVDDNKTLTLVPAVGVTIVDANFTTQTLTYGGVVDAAVATSTTDFVPMGAELTLTKAGTKIVDVTFTPTGGGTPVTERKTADSMGSVTIKLDQAGGTYSFAAKTVVAGVEFKLDSTDTNATAENWKTTANAVTTATDLTSITIKSVSLRYSDPETEQWVTISGGEEVFGSDKKAANAKLTIVVELKAADGKCFTETTKVTAKEDGVKVSSYTLNADGTITATIDYTITAASGG